MLRVKKDVAGKDNSIVKVLATLTQLLNSCSEMSLEDSSAGTPEYVSPPTRSCFSRCLFCWVVSRDCLLARVGKLTQLKNNFFFSPLYHFKQDHFSSAIL